MATAARTRLPAVDPKQRLSCGLCDKYQPGDGKLLHCSHIMCVGCLKDSISRDGSVRCLLCPDITTKPRVAGVDLIKQLISCSQYLYPNESAVVSLESDASTTSRTSSMSQSTLYCNTCDENDVIIEATHQCVDCDGLPMCGKHAERHPKTRLNAGHHVTLCSNQERCLLHPRYGIIAFCRTCDDVLCHQCQLTSHGDHDVIDLSTAAEEKYSQLQGCCSESGLDGLLPEDVPGKSSSTSQSIISGLASVTKALDEIEVEAEAASVVINDAFDTIESLVSETRESCLDFIDQKLWKDSKPLELTRKQLALLQQKEDTLRCLATKTECPQSNPVHEIRATQHILENLKPLSSIPETNSDCGIHSPIQAHISSLDEVSRALRRVVSFGCTESPFVSSVPVPSGEKKKPMASSTTTEEVGLQLISPFGPTPSTPEVELLGVPQSVLQSFHVSFDPVFCPPTISLSENNRVATQTSSGYFHTHVASTHGFSSGCHSWSSVFIRGSDLSRSRKSVYRARVGVATSPINIRHHEYYFGHLDYSWDSYGWAYKGTTRESDADLHVCTDGDELVFTLDFDSRTLACQNSRSGEVRTMQNIDCSQRLYPAAYLPRLGMKVAYR